jgi:energy-coupling factor transport system permease protein
MDQEIYLDRNTFFHRLDPRTKIAILLVAFVVILYFDNPFWVLPVSAVILIHGYFSESLVNLKRIRFIMIILTISSMILWSFFANGKTPFFWVIELEAFKFAIARTLVMLSLITEGMIFLSTTRTEEFVLGMIRFGLPYRVGFAISTAFRMVPTIVSNVFIIAQAQRSRGLDLDSGNLLERVRKYIPLLIPVFVSTIRNTNVFGMALEAKGFGAQNNRTFYYSSEFRTADFLVMAFLVLLFAVTTYLKVAGFGIIPGLTKF